MIHLLLLPEYAVAWVLRVIDNLIVFALAVAAYLTALLVLAVPVVLAQFTGRGLHRAAERATVVYWPGGPV
jgi:hypothetical protein